MNTYDAIVIGSGISGGWAAKELCEHGLTTLLLERGRPVAPQEMPVVRDIVRKTAPGYKIDDIVQAIAHSNPFMMRTAAGGQS